MAKGAGRRLAWLVVLWLLAGCSSSAPGALVFQGPSEQTVSAGETLPGTNIRFVGQAADGAEVMIGNQRAIKKFGDSLDWSGSPVPGVEVSLGQRVVNSNAQRLITAGTVKIVVQKVAPVEAQFPDQPAASYAVPVAYNVPHGQAIPGTTITYEGKTGSGAKLAGVSGYPYRKFGDSITWRGRLRPGVYLDMTVRVLTYEENALQVSGTAAVALTNE